VKGKVILFSSIVLLMVFAVAPLLAPSASACQIVPASVVANGVPTLTIVSVTPYSWGFVGKYDLTIPNLLTIGTKGIDVRSISTLTGVFDSKTKIFNVYSDGGLYVIGSPTDGFRYYPWSFIITEYNYDPSTNTFSHATVQCVAFGFGIFAGDILVLHYAGPNQVTGTWTGYVIIP